MTTFREQLSQSKLKKYFSFFQFYFYVIKRSPKKYDLAHGNSMDYFSILMTPFILWIISMFVFLFVGHGWATVLFIGLGAGMVLNLIFTRSVISEAYAIQRKLNEERREMEKEARRKKLEEERRKAEEYRKEQRRRAEQYRQEERKRTEQNRHVGLNQLYSLLGIKPTTDINIIKKAYRQKAKQHHPDKIGGDESTFIEIKKAYDTILTLIDSKAKI